MKNKTELNIGFKLLVLFLCMASFGAWFLLSVEGWLFSFVCGLLMVSVSASRHYFMISKQNMTWFVLLIIVTLFMRVHMNLNGYIGALLQIFPLYMLFFLKNEYKYALLHFLKKAFGTMILVSLLWYLMFLAGFQLPNFELVKDVSGNFQYIYAIYYMFIIRIDLDILSMLLPRFQFVFYEPGYFGCLMAVLLYINGFKFDKNHWEDFVFLPSLVLSFSLAGIGIAIFGFFSYTIKNSQHKVRWLLLTAVLFSGFYLAVINYNEGDNLINNALLARMELDDRSGIKGNTRFSEDLTDYFWTKFIYSQDIWFGMENSEKVMNHNNVDYVSFIIRHGFFALISLLAFLYYPVITDRKNRYNLLCLAIIYTLIFVQGSFCVLWTLNVVLLVLGVNNIRQARNVDSLQTVRKYGK